VSQRYAKSHHATEVARFAARYHEFTAAIGWTSDSRLAWVWRFIHLDLAQADDRERAAFDLDALTWIRFKAWTGKSRAAGPARPLTIRPDDVEAIQLALRSLLTTLTPGRDVALPSGIVDSVHWDDEFGVSATTSQAGLPRVLVTVLQLLTEAGGSLRRCESCRRLFVQGRIAQRYCSRACGTKDRVAKWRLRNQERLSEVRHRQYARKVRRKYPNAKIVKRTKGAGRG
jgi:hypothetical protein